MTAREELAAVLAEHEYDVSIRHGMILPGCKCGWVASTEWTGSWVYDEHVADALLASPALAGVIREAKAEAWDECIQGVAWAFDHGPDGAALGYARDHNPYRDHAEEPT